MTRLGDNIKRIRVLRGLSRQQVCESFPNDHAAIHLTVEGLRRIEEGDVFNPRILTVQALAKILHISVDTLLADQLEVTEAQIHAKS